MFKHARAKRELLIAAINVGRAAKTYRDAEDEELHDKALASLLNATDRFEGAERVLINLVMGAVEAEENES